MFVLLLLGDLVYLLLLISALSLGKDTAAANVAMSIAIMLYWPMPALLSIGALAYEGQFKGSRWRAFRLFSWAIILPEAALALIMLATVEACRLDWLHCLPY